MVQFNVNLEGKTVLVTGAAGFIGSNLVKRLFHDVKNIRVVGLDSITDYYDVNIKYERLNEIESLVSEVSKVSDGSSWKFVKGNLADKTLIDQLFTEEKFAVGTVLKGTVARMTDFGAFVELTPGIDALLHVSQIAKEHIEKPSDVLKIGQEIEAKVVDFNEADKKISLSMKALLAPEEDTAEATEEAPAEDAE